MPGSQENNARSRIPEVLLTVGLLLLIAALFCFFLKDILLPFLRLELQNDVDGAQALLRQRGLLGFLTVTLVETLQMVVVFIPAEFIQISSGLSFPFPIALLLCDLGVCLGATIIFVLVRGLRFHSRIYEKRRSALDRLSAGMHARSVALLLYLLFFMPIIPFGAICYSGSSTRIRYGRYLFTVATGVIPSIVVSNLMGAAGRAFLVNGLPFWLLLLIIAVLAAALFVFIFLFLDRVCFKESDGTPDSPVQALVCFIVGLWVRLTQKLVIEDEKLHGQQAPYIVLCNHESACDFYFMHRLSHPRNPCLVGNKYFTTRPILKTLTKKAGIIPKKLFTMDVRAAMGIIRTLRKGFPVIIFPEGRLSLDGRSNPIVEPGALLYKKSGVDLVLARIQGAYYAKPKWRPTFFRTVVRVSVERVLRAEEMARMTDEELNALIADTLYTDESQGTEKPILRGGRAKGLENLLYRCADCGALYTTHGKGNALLCTACGAAHTLDRHYRFTSGPSSIPAYFDAIRAMERAELDSLSLSCEVNTEIFGKDGKTRKERGACSLTLEAFSYRSENVTFSIPTENLPALAFSCGKEFELYHDDELHYFYPVSQPQQAARWSLIVDLLKETRKEPMKP